jgi:hypothetical protein
VVFCPHVSRVTCRPVHTPGYRRWPARGAHPGQRCRHLEAHRKWGGGCGAPGHVPDHPSRHPCSVGRGGQGAKFCHSPNSPHAPHDPPRSMPPSRVYARCNASPICSMCCQAPFALLPESRGEYLLVAGSESERFFAEGVVREARLQARLKHPYVTKVYARRPLSLSSLTNRLCAKPSLLVLRLAVLRANLDPRCAPSALASPERR